MFLGDTKLLPKWAAAKAAVRAGARNAIIGCCGDSTTAGMGNNIAYASGLTNSYPNKLVANLSAAGLPSLLMSHGDANTASLTNLVSYDSRNSWSSQTGWGIQAGSLGCGMITNTTTATARWIKAFAGTWDTIEIVYINYNAASIPVYINGGATAVQTISAAAGGSSPIKATISVTRGVNNTVEIGPTTTGNALIVGVNVYDSTNKQVLVYNCGWSGGKVTDLDTITNNYSYGKMINFLAADLYIVNIGINDVNTGLGTYLPGLADLITRCRVAGDCIVCIPTITANAAFVQDLRQHVIETAAAAGVLLVDLQRFWPQGLGPEVLGARAQGLINADNTHPTISGYQKVADILAAKLLAA